METSTPTTIELQSRAELPTKLLSYAGLHDAVLRDLDRLERVAATAARTPSAVDGAALLRWWDRFERSIVHHHEREDDLVFPSLIERGAAIDPILTADHHELVRLMEQTRKRLGALRDRADRDAGAALATAVRALDARMADHLGREEAVVFPAYDELLSDRDHAELERAVSKDMSLRDIAFAAPWVLDRAHPRVEAHISAEAPAPLRFLFRVVWRLRYRAIAAPVLRAR